MSIAITLPYPPSANRMWRNVNGRVVKAKEGRDYMEQVRREMMGRNVPRLTGDVAVTLNFYRPRKSGDLDNRLKQTLDSLTGIAWDDDKQVVEIHACRFEDKANPRVELTIAAVKGGA